MGRLSSEDLLWWCAFVALSVGLALPLWLVTYPPGVDLPQHAAQVAIALGWFDDSLPYRELYEYNALSQSVLGNGLLYALARVVPLLVALKITISLALVALPIVSLRLIRVVSGDRFWVFSVFPVAYSFSFYWGFLNFIIAAPLGLLLVSISAAQVSAPSRRRLVALMLVPIVVFLGHILVLAFAGAASAAVLFMGLRGRERFRSLAALALVVPLACAWFIAVKLSAPSSTGIPMILGYGLSRFTGLFNHTVGIPNELAYAVLGALAVLAPLLAGARFVAFGWRWAPLLLAVGMYFAVPHDVLGVAFLYPRYSLFIVPTLLLALRPGDAAARQLWVGRGLLVAVALAAVVSTCFRFAAFEREARSFQDVAAHIEPGTRVLGLTYGSASEAIPYPVYLHWVAWLQVERAAVADFSFAEFFPNRFRYKAGRDPNLPNNVEWAPQAFRWAKHDGATYAYFLIRNRPLMSPGNFIGATTEFELVIESPPWSLVRQR